MIVFPIFILKREQLTSLIQNLKNLTFFFFFFWGGWGVKTEFAKTGKN